MTTIQQILAIALTVIFPIKILTLLEQNEIKRNFRALKSKNPRNKYLVEFCDIQMQQIQRAENWTFLAGLISAASLLHIILRPQENPLYPTIGIIAASVGSFMSARSVKRIETPQKPEKD